MATYNPKTGLYERDAASVVFVKDRRHKRSGKTKPQPKPSKGK